MAKKKRPLGRRPRPAQRGGAKKQQPSPSTAESATDESADPSAQSQTDEETATGSEEPAAETTLSDEDAGSTSVEDEQPSEQEVIADEGGGADLEKEAASDSDGEVTQEPTASAPSPGESEVDVTEEERDAPASEGNATESDGEDLGSDKGEPDAGTELKEEGEPDEPEVEGEPDAGTELKEEGEPDAERVESTSEYTGPTLVEDGPGVDEDDVENVEQFLKGLVEAIVFSADKPQTAKDVARAARLDKGRAQELIDLLIEETKDRGVRLVSVADGYAFRTNSAYSNYVREFLAQRPVRLSRAQLETLAIIAYRQPLTRPEVDDIRGVDSGGVIKVLLERELIRVLGKKDEPGRPMIYGTTNQFLELFSLSSLRDLPTLREFTELSDDSRAKFESEVGEPAPEGPIDPSAYDAAVEGDSSQAESSESEEGSADEASDGESTHDGVAEEDSSTETSEESEGPSSDQEPEVAASDEEPELSVADEEEFPDDDDDDDDESESEDGSLGVPEVSAADEEEFPDDEDDDEDDEDDEDDDDED